MGNPALGLPPTTAPAAGGGTTFPVPAQGHPHWANTRDTVTGVEGRSGGGLEAGQVLLGRLGDGLVGTP